MTKAKKVVQPRKPHPHDVLCGRGGQSNNHPGNEWYRRLVRCNRALYRSCPKHTKLLVAKAIVQAVQQQDPPGDFIKVKENDDGSNDNQWVPITYSQALNKTSQALREKESRGTTKKAQPQQQQQQQQYPTAQQEMYLDEIDRANNPDVAKDTANDFQPEGVQATMPFAEKQQAKPTTSGEEPLQNSTTKIPQQRAGQKRKLLDSFVKPSWWGTGLSMNDMKTVGNTASGAGTGATPTAAAGTLVTPSIASNYDSETSSNKRTKTIRNAARNADTNAIGGAHEVSKMGRGLVSRVNEPAASPVDTKPLPVETTLRARQSSMVRFLTNTGIFGRGTSQVATALPPPPMGGRPFESTAWPQQQTEAVANNNSQYQQQEQQRSSMQSLSSDHRMGRMSVQQLRFQRIEEHERSRATSAFENNKLAPRAPESEEESLADMPTLGLLTRDSTDGGYDVAPPPPAKGLRTQMSDWLTSVFPSPTKQENGSLDDGDNYNTKKNNNIDPRSLNNMDNERSAIPPPPGGGAGLGRGVSSTIFGLVESPSLFLTTLKSGVSSIFGDSMFSSQAPQDSSPIRRFPSSFRQQQQQQQIALRQPFGGKGGAMTGHQPVLGERAQKRASLLDDFDETPMEKALRNA